MSAKCWNPLEQDMHNQLGLECDGEIHRVKSLYMEHKSPDTDPWYTDGQKVAGAVATIIMLTVTILFCMLLVWFFVKVLF